MEAFLEWYVYDYTTSKGRRRIVDRLAEEEGARLPPELRELLEERRASHLSLYAIEEVAAGGRLQLSDLLLGGQYPALDAGLARLARPGDLLLGRRFGSDEGDGRISRGTVLLPGAMKPGLLGVAERGFAAYREERYQATWTQFLREAGYVLFHYLLSPEAAAVYERTSSRQSYFDPRPSVEAMHKFMRRLAEEEASRRKAAAGDDGENEQQALPVERTAGGILIPGRPKPPAAGQGGILLPGQLRK